MSHHIVEAKELKFSYPDSTHALFGISFTIRHGESVAIVGANGFLVDDTYGDAGEWCFFC